jgi:hypothetical protein
MTHSESQVLICAGIPGKPGLTVEGGKPYPETAVDLAKVIREHGLTVSFEDERQERKYVEHKAADVFLPIIQVAIDILTGISSGFFTMFIADLLGLDKAEKSILHVEYRIADRRGNVEEFKANGPGKEVMEALDKFEQRLRG